MEYILQLLFLRSSVHREHETAEHEFWVTDGIFLETLRMFYVFFSFHILFTSTTSRSYCCNDNRMLKCINLTIGTSNHYSRDKVYSLRHACETDSIRPSANIITNTEDCWKYDFPFFSKFLLTSDTSVWEARLLSERLRCITWKSIKL